MTASAARAPADDGYEITTWEPRGPLDRAALLLERFGLRHRAGIAYTLVVALTVGLLWPYLPLIATPAGVVLTLLAVAPVTGIMLWLWRRDRTSHEPLGLMVRTFLLGASFAVLASFLNDHLGWLPEPVHYLLVVGPGEEIIKLLAVYVLVFRDPAFDHPIDGLFYGIAAGAGFVAIENVTSVIDAGRSGGLDAAFMTAGIRAVVSVPGHLLWTGLAGYYLGLAKFNPEHGRAIVIKGLLIAGFVHGVFDLTVTTVVGIPGLLLGLALHVAMGAWVSAKAARYYRYHGLHDAPAVRVPVAGPPARACATCAGPLAAGADACPRCEARATEA